MTKRLLFLPVGVIFACILAGLYGVLHNQITYTVSPQYFHEFKFNQFMIPPDQQNRFGASIVGWEASWWMGTLIGPILYLLCLFVKGNGQFVLTYLQAAFIVVMTTLALGLGALIYGYVVIGPDNLPVWMSGRQISDPVAFARAGNMHNCAYLGGVAGLAIAAIWVIRSAILSRRR